MDYQQTNILKTQRLTYDNVRLRVEEHGKYFCHFWCTTLIIAPLLEHGFNPRNMSIHQLVDIRH
jgi:hypothetical protein